MPGKAAKITVTEKQFAILNSIAKAKTSSVQLVQRAKIILHGFAATLNQDIADLLGIDRHAVGLWRKRWQQSFDALVAIECRESHAAMSRSIEQVLSDAPRSGSPGTFTAEQVTQILAVACEPPEKSGRPINNWTQRELTDEVTKRQIVSSISESQVGRYLKEADLQPHRSKYWLNTKEKCPETFQQQVEIVCQTYLQAPELYFQANTHTISVDEMPSIQAIERIAKPIPMQPGKPERIEYEYIRHGTLCLIGNWDVVEGQMIAPTISQTRNEEDLYNHIYQTVQTDRHARWIFVMDNLNVHCSETLVRYIAQLEGIDPQTLGKKGKSGIMESMSTRQEFLSNVKHRVRFVYTPKHSSWMNQIEIIFGIVQRRAISRGSFKSLDALRTRLLDFIDYFNLTFAKPLRWTFTGRPVKTKPSQRPKTWNESWVSYRENRKAKAIVA